MKAFEQSVRTIPFHEIEEILENTQISHIIDTIQEGFVAYSRGRVVVPTVGEMLFQNPPGETHIKYGYILEDQISVADLTGVAIQDIQICKLIARAISDKR